MFGHDQATTYTLFYNASIIQDIKQKYIVIIYPFYDVLYGQYPLLFAQHTNYGGIRIINVFYQVVDEGRAITSHITSLGICIILSKHFQVAVVPSSFLNDPISYSIARCFS